MDNFTFWAGVVCAFITVFLVTSNAEHALYGTVLYIFLMIVASMFDGGEDNGGY